MIPASCTPVLSTTGFIYTPFLSTTVFSTSLNCVFHGILMAKLMMTLWIILRGHGLMAILASVSGMMMVHVQITLKGETAELRPWQERPT